MDATINKVIKNGDGNAIVMAALLGAAIANSLPTPFDAIYFNRQQKLKQDLEAGKITPKTYWYHDIGEYYLWTTLWYVCLIGIVKLMDGNFNNNVRLVLVLASGGLVIGVMQKNIQKDEDLKQLTDQQQKALNSNA
jgi:hypothetical protein